MARTSPRLAQLTLRRRSLIERLEPIRPEMADLIAGLSVFLILIPQGLAYAELAGMPTHLGLIAGMLPPIVASFVVSSPYLQTGPTALTALLVGGALASLATAGSNEYVMLGSLLALIVGVIRIGLGLMRLGIMAYFVSQPVLTGFTTGAALLIAGSQVPAILGVPGEGGRVLSRAADALSQIGDANVGSVAIGVLTLVLSITLRKVHKLFPAVLIAVAAAWVISVVFNLDVATIGDLPSGVPALSFDLPWGRTTDLLLPGAVIALVGFAEPASIARTYAAEKRESWSANQEFISQGVANIASAATGAFPVGGSFGRSSLNERAGARTRWSGAVTGLTMLAFLPFVSVLESIPRAALAAVVVSAAISLVRFDRIAAMWDWSKPQSATAAATLGATLLLDPRIDQAIMVGIGLSISVHLWREVQVSVTIMQPSPDKLFFYPHGVLWFGSVNQIVENILASINEHPEVDDITIVLDGVGRLDLTAAGDLAEFANDGRANGLRVHFEGIPPHAKRLFTSLLQEPEDEVTTDS